MSRSFTLGNQSHTHPNEIGSYTVFEEGKIELKQATLK